MKSYQTSLTTEKGRKTGITLPGNLQRHRKVGAARFLVGFPTPQRNQSVYVSFSYSLGIHDVTHEWATYCHLLPISWTPSATTVLYACFRMRVGSSAI